VNGLGGIGGVGGKTGWAVFAVVVVVMLALDLGVFNRKPRAPKFREAALWSLVWISVALAFNAFVLVRYGADRGLEFFQAWLIEKALSVDNLFVFLAAFSYFAVPAHLQHRVLFWGIVGAVVARGAFVGAGAALIRQFHWVMYLLGGFLVYTAIKILVQKDEEMDPSKNIVLRLFRRVVPTSPSYDSARFVTRVNGRIMATPLLAVLVVVDAADVMFAVDSIPAVFGVTTDIFIVLTSNIFAILGLRSLFFLIAALVQKLRFLKLGVAVILAFIGVKILIDRFYPIPLVLSLGVLAGVLLTTGLASVVFPEKE
jgi:tellurite resistance protein TerC